MRRLVTIKVKSIILLVLVLGLLILAGGCWNRREINDLAMVSAAGMDYIDGRYRVTAEIFRPGMPGGGRGGVPGRQSIIATGEGPTVFSAIRNLALKVPRRTYWAHGNVVVVGEDLARRGMEEVIDFWDRDPEARRSSYFLITQGQAADLIVRPQAGIERSLGREIAGLAKTSRSAGYSYVSTLHHFLVTMASGSTAPTLAIVEFSPQMQPPPPPGGAAPAGGGSGEGSTVSADSMLGVIKDEPVLTQTVRVSGVGVFRQDKMIGQLNARETRGMMWVRGLTSVNNTLRVECPAFSPAPVTLEVIRSRPKVVAKVIGGRPQVKVEIKAEGNLVDQGCADDLTVWNLWGNLEQQGANVIRGEILEAVRKAQELRADVFGFGEALHRSQPKVWAQIKQHWEDEFSLLPVEVEVEFKLRRSGLDLRGPGRGP
ncbi:MAG: Ger(x)C family spore germination protein [Clostridia bacterium]|nr:Ger(x)C family spore germination protein [Clostridia bacterium]